MDDRFTIHPIPDDIKALCAPAPDSRGRYTTEQIMNSLLDDLASNWSHYHDPDFAEFFRDKRAIAEHLAVWNVYGHAGATVEMGIAAYDQIVAEKMDVAVLVALISQRQTDNSQALTIQDVEVSTEDIRPVVGDGVVGDALYGLSHRTDYVDVIDFDGHSYFHATPVLMNEYYALKKTPGLPIDPKAVQAIVDKIRRDGL